MVVLRSSKITSKRQLGIMWRVGDGKSEAQKKHGLVSGKRPKTSAPRQRLKKIARTSAAASHGVSVTGSNYQIQSISLTSLSMRMDGSVAIVLLADPTSHS